MNEEEMKKNLKAMEKKMNEETKTEEVTNTEESKKTNEEIAFEVINGDWGEGKELKQALKEAGYDYKAINKIVNEKIGKEERPDAPIYYVMKTSDELESIAEKFETSVEKILKLNNISDPKSIFAGNQIRVK